MKYRRINKLNESRLRRDQFRLDHVSECDVEKTWTHYELKNITDDASNRVSEIYFAKKEKKRLNIKMKEDAYYNIYHQYHVTIII